LAPDEAPPVAFVVGVAEPLIGPQGRGVLSLLVEVDGISGSRDYMLGMAKSRSAV
jgi:hypothetical protein